jgi:hypothetical protein
VTLGNAMNKFEKTRSQLFPIIALITICFVIGLITVRDYGESWDEPSDLSYADYSIQAYQHVLHPQDLKLFSTILNEYGPAYFILAYASSDIIKYIDPSVSKITAWHLVSFVMFMISTLLLYLLSRRWIGKWAALGATLLFVSQPLFWGHAFINPKDIPFMGYFLASIYLGFEMVDKYFSSRPNCWLIAIAGIVLGLTISFRSAGPLAGLIVCIYAIAKSPQRSIVLLVFYVLLASITTYLTWPFLWGAPLLRFLESLQTMSKFPFLTKVLFMGKYYQANKLPWFYYPVILGIQLTEPMILLAIAGLGIAVRRFFKQEEKAKEPLLLFIGWFMLPVIAIIIGSTLYDNGRQLFFLLPPVFLLVGLSMEALISLIHSRWVIAGIVLLFMVPGVSASIKLHPYEYTYYNSLVGGAEGAYHQYEMDYWGTSYKEAAEWLNEHAAADSTIWATGPSQLLELYLRPDLKLSCTSEIDCGNYYDYVVTLARWKDERQCRGADTVFTVGRTNAIFSVVKQLPPGKLCK